MNQWISSETQRNLYANKMVEQDGWLEYGPLKSWTGGLQSNYTRTKKNHKERLRFNQIP